MYTFNNNLTKEEYDAFVENYSMASFMQEYNWSNIKDNWGNFHCGLYKDNKLVGVCLVLIKKIKFLKLFYIPRGYLIDFTNFDDLKAMTDNIKKLAKKNNAYVVKIDPNFCISDNSFKDEEIEHNYSKNYELKNNNLIKLGYKNTGLHKEFGKNLQPQYNVFAPVINKDNQILSEEEILKTYKSKFKYYLGSFHEKRGVTFEVSNKLDDLDKFIELLRITEKKQNISLRNKEYFIKLLNNFKDRAFLFFGNIDLNKYLDFLTENNSKEEDIEEVKNLIKDNGNKMTLSTGLLLLPSNKKGIRTSEYLYAGNSLSLNKLNVSAGLVFEMIKYSMKNKCHYCNLGGVDGNLNDHLTTFKQKFNGRIMEFSGEYDLPTSWIYYPIKIFYPVLLKIYILIRKR
jgi:serine/alanine adding enzyme